MSVSQDSEYVFKISVVGSFGAGKTSLINRYIDRSFQDDYKPTLGANIVAKDVVLDIDGRPTPVRLVIWDLAGQERYEAVRSMYFQGCAGGIFVYDITRRQTFEEIQSKWLPDFRTNADEDALYILIANKIDLEPIRKVQTEEGQALGDQIGATSFLETSAKSGANVDEMFLALVKALVENSNR